MDRTLKTDLSSNYASLTDIRDDARTSLIEPAVPTAPTEPTTSTSQTTTSEVTLFQKDEVGFAKFMETKATLYRNGHLVVNTYTRNDNWTGGLRGKVLVVAIDGQGRAIWISQEFRCATRCSVPDMSCASQGRETFVENFPAKVGEMAQRLHIYQADTPSYVDLRSELVEGIRRTISVITELKDLVALLK
jgi:hypothetical protein